MAELAAQRTDLIAQLSSRDTTISGLTAQRAALLTLVSTEQLRLGELLLQAGLSAASTLAGQSSARPPPSRSPSRAVTKPRQAHSPTLVGMAGITGRSPQQQIRDEHIQPIVISDASGPPSVTPSPLRPSLATDAAPPHPILATISALTADLPTPGPSLPPANCNCTPGVSGARLICERRLQTSQRDGELTPTRRPPYVDVLSTIPGHQPSPFLIQSNEPIGPVTPPTPPVGDHPAPQFYDLFAHRIFPSCMELRLAGGSDEIPNFSPVHYPTPDQRSQAILPLSALDGLPKVKEVYTLEQQALSKHCLSASIVYIQKIGVLLYPENVALLTATGAAASQPPLGAVFSSCAWRPSSALIPASLNAESCPSFAASPSASLASQLPIGNLETGAPTPFLLTSDVLQDWRPRTPCAPHLPHATGDSNLFALRAQLKLCSLTSGLKLAPVSYPAIEGTPWLFQHQPVPASQVIEQVGLQAPRHRGLL